MKGIGYLISTVSVLLLATVAWQSTVQDQQLRIYLVAGVVTAIIGMIFRYASHERDRRERASLAEERQRVVRGSRSAMSG